ncbi:Isochorismatase hydrolase [Neocallimastix lanati (nom. inval.)]|jgi:nicotinamidase-related amidase|uniref:Isochorismatase hydrolase n=1 Tax=Neocallimastix californiae TaxID=1754190 RepID=A0A1Y2ED64_9FUNG|nr:Isochorismatase hydrolase [Neocallimastix sp. JGI-2020a]ORY69357.1 Isochorismatase hydrolase [Neocallimastix californiae]|eukprot:ORY69357.1 Isochorismatase hydrolase [Neocallimastix californiae]
MFSNNSSSLVKNSIRCLSSSINPATTAVFVCDIQDKFKNFIYGFDNMVNTASKMCKIANQFEIPIVVTEQNPKAFGKTVKEIDISKAALVQEKSKFSMMTPEIKELIHNRFKTKSVIICGLESHVCILQTTLDLLNEGIDVYILADGVSSINKSEIDIARKRCMMSGANITSSESILFQLLGDAKNPNFKFANKLIKETKEATKEAMDCFVRDLYK